MTGVRVGRAVAAMSIACALALALAMAGCAGMRGKTRPAEPPTAAPAPSAGSTSGGAAATRPPARSGAASGDVPRAAGAITAPWDTAAQSRDSRRLHVYPEGESAIARRLLATLPEPGAALVGATTSQSPSPAAPVPAPAPSNAAPKAPGPPPSASCWEVQILTTIDKRRAEKTRDEAERELDVAAWIRESGGIYRVRLGGCLTMDGAAELAGRVRLQGWPEAFRVPRDP